MPDVVTLPGGSPTDVLVLVSVDESTIFGSGAPNNPLTAGGGTLVEQVGAVTGPDLVLGASIYLAASSGLLAFEFANASSADAFRVACVNGMVVKLGLGVKPTIKTRGLITLTNAEWENVIDGGGAPSIGVPYYLSATNAGNITTTEPSATGDWVSIVGYFVGLDSELGLATFLLQPTTPFAHA